MEQGAFHQVGDQHVDHRGRRLHREGPGSRPGTCAIRGSQKATEQAPRRASCYDAEALAARKENKPAGSAVVMAEEMGIALLTEARYRVLQTRGDFDLETSSGVLTPVDVHALGGALFCDRWYGQVFTYHNGVQSYHAARGFRGSFQVEGLPSTALVVVTASLASRTHST